MSSGELQWREAVEAAAATKARIGVEHGLSLEVVHYYLSRSNADRTPFVPDGGTDVLIIADQIRACQPVAASQVLSQFPRVLARFRGVSIIARDAYPSC